VPLDPRVGAEEESAAPSRRKRLSNPVGVADSHTINGSLIGPIMSILRCGQRAFTYPMPSCASTR